jgi:hypothetical protein
VQSCQDLFPWYSHIYQNGERFRTIIPSLIRIAEANEHGDWLKAAKAISVLGLIGDRQAEPYLLRVAETSRANAHIQKSAILALTALDDFPCSLARKRLIKLTQKTEFPEISLFIQQVIGDSEKERSSNGHREWPPFSPLLRYGLQPPPLNPYSEYDEWILEETYHSIWLNSKGWSVTWRGRTFHLADIVPYRHRIPADARSALRTSFSCEPCDIGADAWSPEKDFRWILTGNPGGGPGTIIYSWEPEKASVRTVAVLHDTVLRARLLTRGWLLVGTDRRDYALHKSGRMELARSRVRISAPPHGP